MTSEKFFKNNTALITLIAACLVVLISLSVRQVFGMFFMDFNVDLGISNTEFGLAIGIQMLGWGLSGPIFGAIADKYGGHKAITLAFIFYILGVYFLFAGYCYFGFTKFSTMDFLNNIKHFCQMCYAAQKLTECWHRQVDCKTLFFAQPGDLSEIIGTIQFHQILGLA